MKLECGLPGRYACKFCDYVSKRRNELYNHVYRKHHSLPSYFENVDSNSVDNT